MDKANTLTITLPKQLAQRVVMEATALGMSPNERALQALDGTITPVGNFAEGQAIEGLKNLTDFLVRIPSLRLLSHSPPTEPQWWVKLKIDIKSPVAWHVVQNLGFVLNYLSLEEPLPIVFRPVSSPPYLNGGPEDYLSWVIEAEIPFLDAGATASCLQERLPDPVHDEAQWLNQDEFDENEAGAEE